MIGEISDKYKECLFDTERRPLILKVNFSRSRHCVDDKVKVYWKKGDRLFQGKISAVNADGTYNITYTDGSEDQENNVSAKLIVGQAYRAGTLVYLADNSIGYVSNKNEDMCKIMKKVNDGYGDIQVHVKDIRKHCSPYAVCNDPATLESVMNVALQTDNKILLVNERDIREPFTQKEEVAIRNILKAMNVQEITNQTPNQGINRVASAHVIYFPVKDPAPPLPSSINKLPAPYLAPQTQPIPVTITLPGVPFFQFTNDFTHANLGTKFFCMGVYGESSPDEDKTKQPVSIEKRTALNPYTLADKTITLFDRLYFLGTARYAKGVQTYINQEMMELMFSGKRAGTAMVVDKALDTMGVYKMAKDKGVPFLGGSQSAMLQRRRHKTRARRRNIRHTTRARPPVLRARSAMTRRARSTRGGGVFSTAKRVLGKVASSVTGAAASLADRTAGYMIKRAVKKAAPRMINEALKAGTEALTTATTNILPNLMMGTASTAFAGVNSGTTLLKGFSSPVSVAYAVMMRKAIHKLTAIEPEEHRGVWGNQLQDYITYKGVHVGVPQQMYFETHDFRGTHVRHLIYYLKFTVDPMIKDTNGNIVLRHQTADYVPVVLKYEQSLPVAMAETKSNLLKQKTQALASMYDRFTRMMDVGGASTTTGAENKSAENQTAKFLYNATSKALPMQAEAERHTSYVRLPLDNDAGEANIRQKQEAMRNQLNRLAAQNNHLSQETMLHSLYSALHGRGLDMFFAVNFVDDAVNGTNGIHTVFKKLLQGLSGLLAMGATKGALKQSGMGTLLNLFTGGLGTNAAAFAAGVHDAENLVPRLCQIVQVCLRGILSPSYFLFPLASEKKKNELVNKGKFVCTVDEKNTSVAKGAAQNMLDVLLRKVMGQFPTWVVETSKDSNNTLTIGDLLKDKEHNTKLYAGPRVLFQQFSHNWCPLLHKTNESTRCHFLSTPNLRRHAGLNSDDPGVVLAFEAGASYRKAGSILALLQDAYVKSVGTEDALFKKAQLRAMLFGNTHYASVEYETHVADQLLRAWATKVVGLPTNLIPGDTTDNKSFNDCYLRITTPPDTLNTVIRHEPTVSSTKAAGGAAPLLRRAQKSRRRGRAAEAMFDELDDDDEPAPVKNDPTPAPPTPPAPKASVGPQTWEQKAYDTKSAREMEEQLRVQTITLLLRSMRNRFFKPNDKTATVSLDTFLNNSYHEYFPHTYVVAVVPIRTPCTFHYDPDEIQQNGPYVFTSTLEFHEFFKGGLRTFMKDVYAPCILHYAKVRDKIKGLNDFYKELRDMPRPPLLFHDYNAHRYDRVKGKPNDPSSQFTKSFKDYSAYVKQQRDARREEYNAEQCLMLEKRKKMLMARRMSELADEQHRLLTGQFTPGSRPGYGYDPYAALRWRPRPRDPRYYRRRALEYDVSDGTNALYPDVDEAETEADADAGEALTTPRSRRRMHRGANQRYAT